MKNLGHSLLGICITLLIGGCIRQTTSISTASAIPLTGCAVRGYYAPILLGGTSFNVLVDSGSTDLAVASATCSNCSGLSPTYNESNGSNQGQSVTDTYGSGSWTADVFKDSISLGTLSLSSGEFGAITSQNTFFGTSDCELGSNGANSFQGIMGVGYDTVSSIPDGGFLNQLASSSGSFTNLIAMQMCETGGNLWIENFDSSYMASTPQYSPIVPVTNHYGVTVSAMTLGSTSVFPNGTTSYDMLVDSGTSIGQLPSAVFSNLQTELNTVAAASGNSDINAFGNNFLSAGSCNTSNLASAAIDAALPELTITIGSISGGTFTLSLPATKSYLDMHSVSGVTYYCSGAGSASSSTYIIGATFLRNLITIFDRTNGKIGFATQTGCAN